MDIDVSSIYIQIWHTLCDANAHGRMLKFHSFFVAIVFLIVAAAAAAAAAAACVY